MTTLNSITLHLNREHSRTLGADHEGLHKLTMAAVLGRRITSRAEANLLWHKLGDERMTTVTVTTTEPLPEGLSTGLEAHPAIYAVAGPQPQVRTEYRIGTKVAFAVVAHPVKAIPRDPRRTRVPLRETAEQAHWLATRLAPAAELDLSTLTINPMTPVKLPTKRAVLHRVDYRGFMTVSDPVKLAELIISGVGRGKAYGFGQLHVTET